MSFKEFNGIQKQILALLKNGEIHSGSALGNRLNVSRTYIWKQIKNLQEFGVPIQSHAHLGYQLPPSVQLLEIENIKNHLNEQLIYISDAKFKEKLTNLDLNLFASIDSTNQYLKDHASSAELEIVCAETQTAGRGRFGRSWYSPFGENIYFSMRRLFQGDVSRLSGLSLVISLAILAAMSRLNIKETIQIKWPNDLIWNNQKLSGCLIEIQAESNAEATLIIGIGINVNADFNHEDHQGWTSLYQMNQKYFDRSLLVAHLILSLNQYLNQFEEHGLLFFIEEWAIYDYLKGKEITIQDAYTTKTGLAMGINSQGQLRLLDSFHHEHLFTSGEASLKKRG